MSVTNGEIETLVKITGSFENSGDPWAGVTGDFDGMGISCGVLQWNIGSNSLQPLIRDTGLEVVTATMPTKGHELWQAANSPVKQGLEIVRAWQNGTTLRAPIKRELQAFMAASATKAAQAVRIKAVADKADTVAKDWAAARGKSARTLRELAWFFDLLTQNGGLSGVKYADVKSFILQSDPGKSDDVICSWLTNVPSNWWGSADCYRNGPGWLDRIPDDALELFVLSYLRASISKNVRARGVVMNRKGTIALRRGYVNGALVDLSGLIP